MLGQINKPTKQSKIVTKPELVKGINLLIEDTKVSIKLLTQDKVAIDGKIEVLNDILFQLKSLLQK